MKRNFKFVAGVAGLVLSITSSVSFGYGSEGFESTFPGASWTIGAEVVVSNGAPPIARSGAKSLVVNVLNSLTNTLSAGNSGLVWTDFWTKPVRLSVPAPALDSNATAQVFVNSNGLWCTLSGATGVTNVWASPLVSGAVYPTVNVAAASSVATNWFHVSVLHDYARSNWSLYVQDVPLATNLSFIASGVNAGAWFQMQNLGGVSSNIAWLDDFLVTNKVPVTLADTNSPGATNGITPAYTLTYFNTLGDPRPVETNFGVAKSIGPNAVALSYIPQPNQTYVLLGGLNPDMSGMHGIATAAVNGISSLVDTNALTATTNRYFYKVVTLSPVDGTFALANEDTYAWFRQDVSTPNRWYYSGVPVVYDSATSSSLTNLAGAQFAAGLHADNDGVADIIVAGDSIYWLSPTTNWTPTVGTAPNLTVGSGVAIRRLSGGVSGPIVVAGAWSSSIGSVAISPGWNILGWPYDIAATAANCGFPGRLGDRFTVARGSNAQTAQKYQTGWKFGPTVDLGASDWPQPGEGFLYYYSGSSATTWTPLRQ